MDAKTCNESRVVRTGRIFPNDVNNHNTLFGGKLMSDMDMIASISAVRHARKEVVTASTDSVDFLSPITQQDSICIESFVTFTGTSSMEVFVKVIAENLITGNRKIAATAFLTFVALDENGKPTKVPGIVPESEEEKKLFETGKDRAEKRKEHRKNSKELASYFTTEKPWE
ncbi:acyl-CoA thioesterase [Neobacillus sp. 179-C4.2 HS]|uniref:Acyl-CoA thioesterase n=1 Tax=Neobacillus driksii TaxID=3035913 RepID=A0ABV4Z2J5_9BACI|nr:acyl-CoA thioesterase [Neobacillus sp. 179.-C4.2 HS]MDP5196114.1 acyl-CoA thioesterase [Neobacillus sp. 179.-C4.2 HS]